MRRLSFTFALIQCFLLSFCLAESDVERKERFLNGFVDYLNSLPNEPYTYKDGVIINAQKTNEYANFYHIEVTLKAIDNHGLDFSKTLKCSSNILDLEDHGISVEENGHHCENIDQTEKEQEIDQTTQIEPVEGHEPVHLDNEVQPDNGVTSGEQFVAVPRKQYGGSCVGCSSHVNILAPGVNDLAALAIKHLDRHEPGVKHKLESVLDVERQVQVVNGVRYIIILQVGFDNCVSTTNECVEIRPCKITVLEKSWIRLPDGSKYRAILSNNCTEEWQFGDDGEYIPNNDKNNENNDININLSGSNNDKVEGTTKPTPDYDKIANTGSVDEILKAIHNTDVQMQPQQEKTLTESEIKNLEEQIIPHHNFFETTSGKMKETKKTSDSNDEVTHHVSNVETVKHNADNSASLKEPKYQEKTSFLSEDRKKIIDELINFFNSGGLDNSHHDTIRNKRSYDHDLKIMSLAEKFHKIKNKIYNAHYLYNLAQNLVDYINEMDLEVKNRVLQEVVAAEEEYENFQHFFYIQARVAIPCEKVDCETDNVPIKICNGIIEISDQDKPQILSAFCHEEKKKKIQLANPEMIPLDDPILFKLIKDSLKKIESESSKPNAMKIEKILEANTQQASGRLTKITVSLVYTNCNKTIPYQKRTNCTVVQTMDSNLCEINIHERHWLKEKKISYTCSQRPIEEIFSKKKQLNDIQSIKDSKILDIVDEALQYLEVNSNRNNKQKVVEITSVTTQLIGGLLTQVNFSVGYTKCSNQYEVDLKTCELLKNVPLHNCQVQLWDRPWLEDGKQIKINCDDSTNRETLISRKKRNIHGGAEIKNPNDSEYQSLAKESLQSFVQKKGISEEYEVIKVENVTLEAVSGTVTRIYFRINRKINPNGEVLCYSVIWARQWLNEKEYTVTCNDIEGRSIKKRQIPGSSQEQDLNDPEYKQLAIDSLKKFMQDSGYTQHHEVISVKKVMKPIVSGSKTTIDFAISPTNCTLDSTMEAISSNCKVLDSSNVINCRSVIWEQLWLQRKDIQISCNNKNENLRRKRQLPGGETEQNPNDYKDMAKESLRKFLQDSGTSQHHELLEVDKVITQVVSGLLIKLKFKITPTNCQLDSNMEPTSAVCKVLDPSNIISCQSTIWEQPWLNKRDITVNCSSKTRISKSQKEQDLNFIGSEMVPDLKMLEYNIDKNNENRDNENPIHVPLSQIKRQKRSLMGAPAKQNPNSSEYKKLAEESLQKYQRFQKTNIKHHLTVKDVNKQVVSGVIYKINFIATPSCNVKKTKCTKDILYCHAEIWDRPWKSNKKIDVDCYTGIIDESVEGQEISDRKKRNVLLGAAKEKNINNKEYKALADESLVKYLFLQQNA